MLRSHSNSSVAEATISEKALEAITFLRWRFARDKSPKQFEKVLAEIAEYQKIYERLSGHPFQNARVLEIGFGAQPSRLIAINSMGIDVRGIDLDTPMLEFRVGHIIRILRTNGAERAAKTAVRNLLFDKRERAGLRLALKQRGFEMKLDQSRLLVGDAATYDYGEKKLDLIYSEDVLEDIPAADLDKLVAKLSASLAPDGIALLRPNVFTGITGGHLLEWYPHLAEKQLDRRSEPWEHLRKARYTPNTYLNRVTRLEYRMLFAKHFDIAGREGR